MIQIKGEIGKDVTLLSVVEQMKSETGGDVHVLIDSIGGSVTQGLAIYDFLKNSGKNITTECVNYCASIASIIFLAGSKRIAGCGIMIHNPFISNTTGDAKTLASIANEMQIVESKLEELYSVETGNDVSVISDLMAQETTILPTQAVKLGFATDDKIVAIARLDIKEYNNQNTTNMSSAYNKLMSALGLKPKAMQITTIDGASFSVDREEGSIQIGDNASPDGTYTLQDNTRVIVLNGVVTEVTAEAKDLYTLEEVAEVVNDLKNKIDTLSKENETLKQNLENTQNHLKNTQSDFQAKGRVGSQSKGDAQADELDSFRLKIQDLEKNGKRK